MNPITNNADESYKSFVTNADSVLAETTRLLSISQAPKKTDFGVVKNNIAIAVLNENQTILRRRVNKLSTTASFNESKSGFSELKKLLKAY